MPWKIRQLSKNCPASKPYEVVREDTGAHVSCHDTLESAKRHMAALYANEPKAKP